jgi:glycosyltransferase involved in cell wall biosynthesis
MRYSCLCVVAPCFNEGAVINRFYGELKHSLEAIEGLQWSAVFVDDGSEDGTLEKINAIAAQDNRVTVLSLSRNFGHQAALTAGLDYASGDAVILMDSDLQHPPGLIPEMVRMWLEGNDIVSAVRERTLDASVFKNLTMRLFYGVFNALSDTKIVPGAADFCLLSQRVCDSLRRMPERHRFLRGMVSWVGFRRAFVSYTAAQRPAGTSKFTPTRMAGLALDAVFSFSAAPIRLATRTGGVIVCIAGLYQIYVLFRYFFFRDTVVGWGSLVSLILILGGVQLLFIGVIGEYLARVFEEVKGRPLYVLKQAPGRPTHHDRNGAYADPLR